MKPIIALLACCLFASHLLASEPLTDEERQRLAAVESAARRTPSMREAAKAYSTARTAYANDRRQFLADHAYS